MEYGSGLVEQVTTDAGYILLLILVLFDTCEDAVLLEERDGQSCVFFVQASSTLASIPHLLSGNQELQDGYGSESSLFIPTRLVPVKIGELSKTTFKHSIVFNYSPAI